ncbi:MAG: hypothetical protein IJ737_00055 [Ruminococcus sp.]|nr:hypothetical protein [Ruminococcus sp.]
MQDSRPSPRRIYIIILLTAAAMVISSFGLPLDISRRALVHAAGIDRTDDGYEVTLQIFTPSGAGSETSVDVSAANTSVLKGRGGTVKEALDDCSVKAGRELFFGHLQLICLGQETADLSCLLDDAAVSPAVPVFMSDTTAADILSTQVTTGEISAESLCRMAEHAREYSDAPGCTLLDISDESFCGLVPVLKLEETGGDDSSESEVKPLSPVIFDGAAVVREGRVISRADPDTVRGAVFLTGEGKRIRLTSKLTGDNFELTKKSLTRSVEASGGGYVLRIALTVACDSASDEPARLLCTSMAQAWDSLAPMSGGEVFDLSLIYRQYLPAAYLDLTSRDEPLPLPELVLSVNIDRG